MAVLCDQAAVAFSYSCFMFFCIYQLYQLYLVVHCFVSVFALTSWPWTDVGLSLRHAHGCVQPSEYWRIAELDLLQQFCNSTSTSFETLVEAALYLAQNGLSTAGWPELSSSALACSVIWWFQRLGTSASFVAVAASSSETVLKMLQLLGHEARRQSQGAVAQLVAGRSWSTQGKKKCSTQMYTMVYLQWCTYLLIQCVLLWRATVD